MIIMDALRNAWSRIGRVSVLCFIDLNYFEIQTSLLLVTFNFLKNGMQCIYLLATMILGKMAEL